MNSEDKLLQRLQQLLSKAKQNPSNPSESVISELPFFSSYFQDGLVEYHTTVDPCVVWFQFTGPEFDFEGFQVISEEKLAAMSSEDVMLDLLATLKSTWERVDAEDKKQYPRTLH